MAGGAPHIFSAHREVLIAAGTNTRVNEKIRISPVRLIAADGDQRGIVSIEQAREAAAESGLDLVEVAATARPPVVRIMDWGRFQYEQQKRAKDARKKQHTVSVKEVKLRPRTDDHDLAFKLRNARKFLARGSAVKFTVRFRGPELRRPELGHELLETVQEELSEVASVESKSRRVEGRQLTMMVAPAA